MTKIVRTVSSFAVNGQTQRFIHDPVTGGVAQHEDPSGAWHFLTQDGLGTVRHVYDSTLSQSLSITALQTALAHAKPDIHHSDQGIQYAAKGYTDLLNAKGIQISMSEAGCPTQNAFAERFMRTFKEEHVDYTDYTTYEDAYQQIAQWIETVYMTDRVHSALDYLTPAEFEAAYWAAQGTGVTLKT